MGKTPTTLYRLMYEEKAPAGIFTGRDCAEEALSVFSRVWYVPLIFREHKLFFATVDVKLS